MPKQSKAENTGNRRVARWWLEPGEENCPHCAQTYSYRVELRCIDCDAPICPMCIVRVGEHVVCPDCREAAKG